MCPERVKHQSLESSPELHANQISLDTNNGFVVQVSVSEGHRYKASVTRYASKVSSIR